MLNEDRKIKLSLLAKDLVSVKSLSGEEGELVNYIKKVMEFFSFQSIEIDEVGNITGGIKGKEPGKRVLLDAHLDTVPAEDTDKWANNPFTGDIRDGRIYGRGASDMKGALAAMLCAVSFFREDYGDDFSGEIFISGTVLEEFLEGVAARKVSEKVSPDFVIIGEASDLKINTGQRGRAEVVLETFGRPAHSSHPEYGHNAVYDMMRIIERIKSFKPSNHPLLGEGILELTDIISEPYPGASVVPSYCRATFDRRLLPGEDREAVLGQIEELLTGVDVLEWGISLPVLERPTWSGTTLRAEQFLLPWEINRDHPLVEMAKKGLEKQGVEGHLGHYSFCTNGSHYAGEENIPTIGFGPSRETLAHIDNEYIEIDQLEKGCRGYYGLLQSLCGVE